MTVEYTLPAQTYRKQNVHRLDVTMQNPEAVAVKDAPASFSSIELYLGLIKTLGRKVVKNVALDLLLPIVQIPARAKWEKQAIRIYRFARIP